MNINRHAAITIHPAGDISRRSQYAAELQCERTGEGEYTISGTGDTTLIGLAESGFTVSPFRGLDKVPTRDVTVTEADNALHVHVSLDGAPADIDTALSLRMRVQIAVPEPEPEDAE